MAQHFLNMKSDRKSIVNVVHPLNHGIPEALNSRHINCESTLNDAIEPALLFTSG